MQMTYPRQVICDGQQRSMVLERVYPTDEAGTTFGIKGIARRMVMESTQNWTLAHTHINYRWIRTWRKCTSGPLEGDGGKHELGCAGVANLMAYFGWLHSGESFPAMKGEVTFLMVPQEWAHPRTPTWHRGAVGFNLDVQTKSDPCITAEGLWPGNHSRVVHHWYSLLPI
jgi:hypothetical protein